MRILILGAGTSGRMLAARLCGDQHDVVLIDRNPQALEQVEATQDLLTLQGDVADPRILEQAGLKKCDMVVAVTDQESVNVLACSLAHIAGVPRNIARVSNPSYTDPNSAFNLHQLGIDLVINQQQECARDLFNILRIPGAQEAVDLLNGRVICAGFLMPTDSPLLFTTLKESPHHDLLSTIRFIAYTRGGKIKIPRGDTQFQIGDLVYMVGQPGAVENFMHTMLPGETDYTRVVIAGGGELGMQLAGLLAQTDLDVTLIEENPERADQCAETLPSTLVINGSTLNHDLMEEMGINHNTAFVAVTGDDENNIMSCLVAEKMGAHFTMARVDKKNYQPIIDSLSLVDRVVSPHTSLINAIYHFVRGSSVQGDRVLQRIPGEVMDILLEENNPWVGQAIIDIKLPRGCILTTILRGDQLLVATGPVVLKTGDRVLLYGLPKYIRKIEDLFV
jgi:trk system potassium uptake protein TrkA